jgi:LCP family protein required for cell wall assembly
VVAVVYFWIKSKDDRLAKIDPFSAITGGRPVKSVDGALNILMLGSDSRDPEGLKGDGGAARTDTIVMLHIPSSHDKAYLVSVPRDYYVYVPKSPDGKHGDTKAKINAAYAWGGATLMVQTLEKYTGVRIDHVMVIDFAGFAKVTDALGGVDMYVEKSIQSIHGPYYRKFNKGNRHFTGEEALDYVRQRYQFPRGDFDRIKHQQEFLKALMSKAASSETLTSPSKLNSFLNAITDAMTVDEGFSLVDMAINFRNLRGENISFLTAPHNGTDKIKGESVVVPNDEKSKALFEAIGKDKAGEYVSANATPKPSP